MVPVPRAGRYHMLRQPSHPLCQLAAYGIRVLGVSAEFSDSTATDAGFAA